MPKKQKKKTQNKKLQLKNTKIFLYIFLVIFIFILLVLKICFKTNNPVKTPVSSSFPTNNLDPQIKNERIDDPLVGLKVLEYKNQNPWLYQLPISSESYVIVYNWEKKAIRARLIIKPDSSVSYNNQVENLKKEVFQKLTELGVDLNYTKVYFTFTP